MQRHVASQTSRHPLWLLAGFRFCFVIAIAVVTRRLVDLIRPSHDSPPLMASLDASFWSHAALTIMHIVPAAIFVLLSVAVLLRRTDGEWLEQIFFPFGAVTGATAYAMSYWAVGGWVERSVVLVFNTWFLLSLGRAYWFRLCGDSSHRREWMTRTVAILVGVAPPRTGGYVLAIAAGFALPKTTARAAGVAPLEG